MASNKLIRMEDLVKVQYFEQYSAQQQQHSNYFVPPQQPTSPMVKIQHEQEPRSNKLPLETSYQIRRRNIIAGALKRLLNKYFISISQEEFEVLLQRALNLKAVLAGSKSQREFAPVVFYYFYVDEIGINTPQDFCKRNGLNSKSFNKRYIKCVNFFRNQSLSCLQSESSEVKSSEEPRKQWNSDRAVTASGGIAQMMAQKVDENLSALEAIDLIYDFVFKSKYFQDNRRQIILKLAEKYEKTSSKLIEAIDWTDQPIAKIYYIMVYYCRFYGASFTFSKVKEAAFQKLQLKLVKEGYFAIKRLFKKFQQNQELWDNSASKENQDKLQ